MKKVLLFAAALFAAASCTENSVNENVASEAASATNMMFSASFADESTRVAVDEEFKVSWYADANGYCDGLSILPTVTLDVLSTASAQTVSDDGNTATFNCFYSSAATDAELRLIHPVDYYMALSSSYTMSVAAQSEGLSAIDYSVANTTFMVSNELHAAVAGATSEYGGTEYTIEGAINMVHVGAAVVIKAGFDQVPDGATLKTVTLKGLVNEVTVDLSVAGTDEGFYTSETVGDIVVTVGAEAATEMTIACNIFPTTLPVGREVVVDFLFSDGSTASKTITIAEEVVFARATFNTINATDCVVDIAEPKIYGDYSYSNLDVTASGATLDVVIGENCEGLAIFVEQSLYWSFYESWLVSDIQDGNSSAIFVTESGTVNLFPYGANAATEYNYVVLEVEDIVSTTSYGWTTTSATVIGTLSDYTVDTFTTLGGDDDTTTDTPVLDISYDYSLEPIVTIDAQTENSITVTVSANNCALVYLTEITYDEYYMSSYDTAKTLLEGVAMGTNGYFLWTVTDTYTMTYSNLSEGDVYLYTLGKGADGSLSETVGYTFSTASDATGSNVEDFDEGIDA